MIRLGSLAGYSFEGPWLLGGWTPPDHPGLFAVMYKPEPDTKPETYAVIYVGHSDNLAEEGFPWKHPAAHCWAERAGSKWQVYVSTFDPPGGGRSSPTRYSSTPGCPGPSITRRSTRCRGRWGRKCFSL